jgi:surface protein
MKINSSQKKYKQTFSNIKKNIMSLFYFIKEIFIFIILIYPIISTIIPPLTSLQEITLKIKDKGIHNIFNYINFCPKPYEVFLNDENITNDIIDNTHLKVLQINTTKENNTINMKFNHGNQECVLTFSELTNITEIDLSKFDVNLKNMGNFFLNCKSLISINFKNFNTSEVMNMGTMFANCYNLVSLDLSGFDTSKVEHMDNMFANCISLTSLNLSNFKSNVKFHSENMFQNCISLKYLDLSNLDTSKNTNMKSMFQNCTSLTSLNLSNFNFNSIKPLTDFNFDEIIISMFYNCTKLNYINIKNYYIKINANQHEVIEQIAGNTTKNLAICFNGGIINEELKQNIDHKYCPTFDCSENYYLYQKKLIEETDTCVDNCSLTEYKYEFENKCYKLINTDTITTEKIEESQYVNNSIDIDINININKTNYTKCNIKDFFGNECKNKFAVNTELESFKNDIIEAIKNGDLSDLLFEVINNDTNYIITEGNEKYQISTLNNQMNMDAKITAINFTECENIIKEKYDIKNEELIIFKLEHIKEEFNIPIIEYAIFSENGTFLNLDDCNNISSLYYIPVNINEDKLFIYDPSSNYYNDECSKYTSDNGTDMTIYDRKNDFNENHLSLCESNCTYKGYNSSTLKAECQCLTKTYLLSTDDLSQDDLLVQIDDNNKKITNLNLIKCSNLISSTEDIKSNTGFFLLAVIIVLFIIVMILFCIKGYNSLENKIDEIISIKFKVSKSSNKKKKKINLIHTNIESDNNNNNNKIKKRSYKNKTRKNLSSKRKINNSKKNIKKNGKKINNMTSIFIISKKERDEFIRYTNDYELNHLSFKNAIKYDKRIFCEYYFSLIRTKQMP